MAVILSCLVRHYFTRLHLLTVMSGVQKGLCTGLHIKDSADKQQGSVKSCSNRLFIVETSAGCMLLRAVYVPFLPFLQVDRLLYITTSIVMVRDIAVIRNQSHI